MTRKTDYDAIASGYDRRYQERAYGGIAAVIADFVASGQRVLEVGCGTGHWLAQLAEAGCRVTGLDPSEGMLERAAARTPSARLVQGRAESLPFADAAFERVACINAIHHFDDVPRFFAEARRVLAPGGRLLSIALDPSLRDEPWFVYDYFPATRALDKQRYPATATLREWLAAAGFVACETAVAEHIAVDLSARDTLDRGLITPSATSQLAILSEAELAAGIARIRADLEAAEARGEELRLRGDLRLYATFGSVPRG